MTLLDLLDPKFKIDSISPVNLIFSLDDYFVFIDLNSKVSILYNEDYTPIKRKELNL